MLLVVTSRYWCGDGGAAATMSKSMHYITFSYTYSYGLMTKQMLCASDEYIAGKKQFERTKMRAQLRRKFAGKNNAVCTKIFIASSERINVHIEHVSRIILAPVACAGCAIRLQMLQRTSAGE